MKTSGGQMHVNVGIHRQEMGLTCGVNYPVGIIFCKAETCPGNLPP
jgi:hypothetical protein